MEPGRRRTRLTPQSRYGSGGHMHIKSRNHFAAVLFALACEVLAPDVQAV